MKLLKQVASDLRKETGWVVFYGFVTAMAIMAFILIGLSYQFVGAQNDAISRFERSHISFIQLKELGLNIPADVPAPQAGTSETQDDYFANAFSKDGNGGTFVQLRGKLGFRQIFLLLGEYADLTPFSPSEDEEITFAASYDLHEDVSDTIQIKGCEYPLHMAPENMSIYHPLYFIFGEHEQLDSTLFVFSHSYQKVQELFPAAEYLELNETINEGAFWNRFILKAPGEQDLTELKNLVYSGSGKIAVIQSMEEYLENTGASGQRTHRTYVLFYISSAMILIGAMLINIYQVLKRRIADYATHHLFGAPSGFIFARMFLFALAYQLLPVCGTIFIMSLNELATPLRLSLLLTGAFAVILIITSIAHKQFSKRFAQGLRRE